MFNSFKSRFSVAMAMMAASALGLIKDLGSKLHDAIFGFMHSQGMILAAAPMRSTDFKQLVEPILNEAFDGVYDLRKDEWKQIFKETNGIARSYHEEPVMYGFMAAPEIPDGMPVSYSQGGILFTKRYVYKVYGLAYALTLVLIEDGEHFRVGAIYAQHLAQSLIETKETLTANVLNRAFNSLFPGGDQVELCSANHPIVGGTFSNILPTAAALSQTSLEQMLVQIRKAVDNTGKKVRVDGQKLVVPPDQMMQAEVLLKSVLRTGSANNDINPIRSIGGLDEKAAVISRLTSPTAWFITTDVPNGLQIKMRRKLKKSMEGDFETDSVRYKGTERYDVGYTDPRCAWGTPGA